jgi:hypothetical protein
LVWAIGGGWWVVVVCHWCGVFLLRNRVVARWAFDEQDRLIEILVDKSAIAP